MYEEKIFCGICGTVLKGGEYSECPVCGCLELYPEHNEGIMAYNCRKRRRQTRKIMKVEEENHEYDFDFAG